MRLYIPPEIVTVVLLTSLLVSAAAFGQPRGQRPVSQVEVTNFPVPQQVEGTVQVSNFPAEQTVQLANSVLTVAMLPPARFQLVGFSTELLRGGAGVLGFARACQADFPDSRMCTSEEIMDTVRIPDLPDDTVAYVRPVLHGVAARLTRDDDTGLLNARPAPYDTSGVNAGGETLAEESNCHGWARGSSGHGALTVDSKGSFDIRDCFTERPVACCAMVE